MNLNIFIEGRLDGAGDYSSSISVDVSIREKDTTDPVIAFHYSKSKPDHISMHSEPVVTSEAFTAQPDKNYTLNFELKLYARAGDDDDKEEK